MKKTYKVALAAGVGMLSLGLAGNAFAFHDGGVAECAGCHSMHNSADNLRNGAGSSTRLLKGTDTSSTCLNCHNGTGSYKINSPNGSLMKAGGDFFWVTAAGTYSYNPGHGSDVTSVADNHGHNVVAIDYGMAADATNTAAPGGTMVVTSFSCGSCHDAHGRVGVSPTRGTAGGQAAISVSGSYGAADPTDGSMHGNYRILKDFAGRMAPVATANSSSATMVDYGSGMSSWCLQCHPNFDPALGGTPMHPVDEAVPTRYNAYVASGNYTGTVDTAYDALVPFERGVADGSLLTPGSTVGADTTSVVMCLSCHRAHASAFDNALRWDNGATFLAESGILAETTTTVMAGGAVPYYKNGVAIDIATEYGEWQRSLCNKCHVKD